MSRKAPKFENATLISIPPWQYLYVLDVNRNVTRLEQGPQRLTLLDHEQVVAGPLEMVMLGPRQYCKIQGRKRAHACAHICK
jgi:hypothetical protein